MSEINLVPKKVVGEQQKQRFVYSLNAFSLGAILLLVLLTLVLSFLRISLNKDYSLWQSELRQKMEELAVYKKTEGILDSLKQKEEIYQTYHKESSKKVDLWGKLKQQLPASGNFQKLEIKEDGSVLLSYESGNFLEAASFLSGLKSLGFQNFSLKSAGLLLGTGRILVTVSLSMIT